MTALQEDIARNGLKMDKENMKKAEEITDEIRDKEIEDFVDEYIKFTSKCSEAGITGEAIFKLFAIYSNNKKNGK